MIGNVPSVVDDLETEYPDEPRARRTSEHPAAYGTSTGLLIGALALLNLPGDARWLAVPCGVAVGTLAWLLWRSGTGIRWHRSIVGRDRAVARGELGWGPAPGFRAIALGAAIGAAPGLIAFVLAPGDGVGANLTLVAVGVAIGLAVTVPWVVLSRYLRHRNGQATGSW